MQSAKVAYELSQYATIIVGSEETIPGHGYPYDTILSSLSGKPSMDAAGLGKVIVQKYQNSYNGTDPIKGCAVKTGSTLSALDTSYLPGFVQELNAWVNMIRADDAALTKIANANIAKKTFNFDTKDNKDFCDFVNQMGTVLPDDSEIMKKGQELRDYVENGLVISHKATNGKKQYVDKTCGLAIYLPELKYSHKYNNFVFARDTYWDDFIKKMFIKLGR